MNNIYVCDFDEVEKLCKTIDSNINTLQNDLNTSKDNLLSTLSSNWNGSPSQPLLIVSMNNMERLIIILKYQEM